MTDKEKELIFDKNGMLIELDKVGCIQCGKSLRQMAKGCREITCWKGQKSNKN